MSESDETYVVQRVYYRASVGRNRRWGGVKQEITGKQWKSVGNSCQLERRKGVIDNVMGEGLQNTGTRKL